MLILAFESSAKAASVALCRDGHLLSQCSQCSGLTHSRTLLPMAEDMLKNAELALQDVDLIAVAHGPGSFTGIRIGVSTVKGLAWAGDKPCVGVSTLEAMAWHGLAAGGYVCPVMDARRSQLYNAVFRINGREIIRLSPDRVITAAELAAELSGYPGEPVYFCGGGYDIARDACRDNRNIALTPELMRYQNAFSVALCALDRYEGAAGGDFTDISLSPSYLRPSSAERNRNMI